MKVLKIIVVSKDLLACIEDCWQEISLEYFEDGFASRYIESCQASPTFKHFLIVSSSFLQACLACQCFLLVLVKIIQILCFEVDTWQGLLTGDAKEELLFAQASVAFSARLALQASFLRMCTIVLQNYFVEMFLCTRRQAFSTTFNWKQRLFLKDQKGIHWTSFKYSSFHRSWRI